MLLSLLEQCLLVPRRETVCEVAALNGHLDCLQYALENGCPLGFFTFYTLYLHHTGYFYFS